MGEVRFTTPIFHYLSPPDGWSNGSDQPNLRHFALHSAFGERTKVGGLTVSSWVCIKDTF